MNTPSNLPDNGTNTTTKYFNNVFNGEIAIDQNTYDAIYSYFEEYTQNKESAKLLAQTVINTAAAQRVDPLVVMTQFEKENINKITPLLALFLNASRVPTSLIGIQVQSKTNPLVSRTILF